MKIALVSDTYLPRINGVSIAVHTLARELEHLGHVVHVYVPAFPDHADEAERVHRFPSWSCWMSAEERVVKPWIPVWARSIVRERFDVVHTQTPFILGAAGLMWARLSGAKVVHTYHTLFRQYAKHYLRRMPQTAAQTLIEAISRRYCNACDLVVAPSTAVEEELLRYRVRTPIAVIPSGIDVARFSDADGTSFKASHGLSAQQKHLLFVGRLASEKNLDFLLLVLKHLVADRLDVKLMIAGAGPYEHELRSLTHGMNLDSRVVFLGYLTGKTLADCYAAADMFVFSSVTESQGLVVAEALAAGTPVVAVGAMGVRDCLASGRGGVMTALDVLQFAGAVRRMLTDSPFYLQKKAECRIEAERWSSKTAVRRLVAAYHAILRADASVPL